MCSTVQLRRPIREFSALLSAGTGAMPRKFRLLLLIVTVCALALLVTPGSAAAQGQSLAISPTWGPVGTKVTVTGTGWPIEYYPSVHITITERRGGGFPRHLGDEFATPDAEGNFTIEITIPASATAGIINISGIIGNGSGAMADFTVTSEEPPPAPKCAPTFIGLHGISESYRSPKAVDDTWQRFKKLMEDRGLPVNPDPDFLQFPTLRIDEFFKYGYTQFDLRPAINILKVPTAIKEGVDYLEEAAARAQSLCAPARFIVVGYSEGAWIARQWLQDTSWKEESIIGIMTLGDPQWDDGTDRGIARFTSAIEPYRPAIPLGWRFGGVCAPSDAVCGGGYGTTQEGSARRATELDSMLRTSSCRSHCPDAYIDSGATAQVAQWLLELAQASK